MNEPVENTTSLTMSLLAERAAAENRLLLDVLAEQNIPVEFNDGLMDVPKEHYETVSSHIIQLFEQFKHL